MTAAVADGKAGKNYGGTSPITRASGKKTIVADRQHPQKPAHRLRHAQGLRLAERLAWRPRLLRQPARRRSVSVARSGRSREQSISSHEFGGGQPVPVHNAYGLGAVTAVGTERRRGRQRHRVSALWARADVADE